MRLDEYIEDLKPDEEATRRQLAQEKSYEVLEYLEDVEARFDFGSGSGTVFGSTAPEIFVDRSNYPNISTGILTPVGAEERAAEFRTNSNWYTRNVGIENVLKYRSGLLNSTRRTAVNVHDAWGGFIGVQREVAIADRPVDVEIGLSDTPEIDLSFDNVTEPRGPRATAESADLGENPHVPLEVEKTLADDDWKAEGAMTYLYNRGFDVYDIKTILSVGALGEASNRRLVPTRWSITAVDDIVGQFLRGKILNASFIDTIEVWVNEFMGNRYWIVLTPGQWEYEFVEMKSPGSVWNPAPGGEIWMGSAHEGYEGRSSYVDETAGAYYAARVGVLEYLTEIDRQAKVLVLREVSDEYWAPVGVWQIRESVRNAFSGEHGEAESFTDAINQILPELPVTKDDLRRKSELIAGLQSTLNSFTSESA